MLIQITQEDIDGATQKHAMSCAVALAFRRMGYDASVGPNKLTAYAFDYENYHVTIYKERTPFEIPIQSNLPAEVNRFIQRFDDGYTVDPIKFNLEVPDA